MRFKIIAALALAATTAFAATPNYGGKWALDKSHSANLPRFYEHVTAHALDVAQTASDLKVGVVVTAEGRDPDKFAFDYMLDGTETKTETFIRTPGGMSSVPTTLKAVPNADGTLTITIDREIKMGDAPPMHGVTVETWKLDETGNKLTIHRADNSPRGKFECDMVFVKG